jgi:hypothetical protein
MNQRRDSTDDQDEVRGSRRVRPRRQHDIVGWIEGGERSGRIRFNMTISHRTKGIRREQELDLPRSRPNAYDKQNRWNEALGGAEKHRYFSHCCLRQRGSADAELHVVDLDIEGNILLHCVAYFAFHAGNPAPDIEKPMTRPLHEYLTEWDSRFLHA